MDIEAKMKGNDMGALINTLEGEKKDPTMGRNAYKKKFDPKEKIAAYKKQGIFGYSFATIKRAPFEYPCE